MGNSENYIKEKKIKGQSKAKSIEAIKIGLEQMEKTLCKINCNEGDTGTGFFLNIINPNKWDSLPIRAIVTNNHVLNEKDILPGKTINFSLNNDKKKCKIIIDESRRTYTSEKYDISIIEIKPNDGISIDSFLEIENKIWKNNPNKIFKGISIYLLHYPDGIESKLSDGIIQNIEEDNYNIRHLCDSDFGSSGGPLICLDSFKVIGIHKGASSKGNWNLGTLIKEPIEELYNPQKIEKVFQKVNNENNEKVSKSKITSIFQNKCNLHYLEKIGGEENKEIGFDFSLLNIDELYVNLIFFNLKLTNKDNYSKYNKFKVDVMGGFFGIDDLKMLKKYLEEIKKKNIPFIVISSGSSGKDAIPICKNYSFIKEVIILCKNYKYNEHYLKKYPGYVKKIFIDIRQVYNYIRFFGPYEIEKEGIKTFNQLDHFIFSKNDIERDKQFKQCPVISAYEYDNFYFLIHKAYAHFFGDMNDKRNVIFTKTYFDRIQEFINKSDNFISEYDKKHLIKEFESLVDKENFVELSIRIYTGESCFCYTLNRMMRNSEKGLISLVYFNGPFLFGLNKYVKENPKSFSFDKNMTLYRNIEISIFDFYLYIKNVNHIICFPAFTSTITKYIPYNRIINRFNQKEERVYITMIFRYYHKKGNISPGIVINDNKAKNGKYISSCPENNEVILFPFTFARITKIKNNKNNMYEIYLDIINRENYIEYTLRDNVENRIKFSSLD